MASGDAATPAAHSTVCAEIRSSPTITPSASTVGDDGAGADLDAEPRQRRGVPHDELLGERGRARRAAFEQQDARATPGRMLRKSLRSDCRAISASAPASSTPVGPPPTMTNVSSRRCAVDVGLALGRLERQQHPAPDLERIVERLEPGCARRPLGMTEVGVRRAGGDDQVVVGDLDVRSAPSSPSPDRAARRRAATSMRCALGEQHA